MLGNIFENFETHWKIKGTWCVLLRPESESWKNIFGKPGNDIYVKKKVDLRKKINK
jgi:hypothetical protein